MTNLRLAWEYRPLTYTYVVYNQNRLEVLNSVTQVKDVLRTESGIIKVTFLKQF